MANIVISKVKKFLSVNCQLFFIALHDPDGEDGKIQGFLDSIGISYTGLKVQAFSLAMNKILSRHIFEKVNIKTPSRYN